MDGYRYVPVDKHDEHGSHFHQGIESFAHQGSHPSSQEQHQTILSALRKEFYSTGDEPFKRMCYRNCFKLNEKKYVEFCLNQSCNGASFNNAAKFMGYLK